MGKYLTILFSFILLSLCVAAQIPSRDVNLSELTFVRQNFSRNYYSSSILTSKLNLKGTDLFLNNSANLIISGSKPSELKQDGEKLTIVQNGETIIRVGALHPFYCYESVFESIPKNGEAGICFYSNDGLSRIIVSRCGTSLFAKNGDIIVRTKIIESDTELHLRIQYTGKNFHVFLDNGQDLSPNQVMSIPCDRSGSEIPVTWSWGVYMNNCAGSTITKAESALTCGTGQADPQVIQNSDGTPYIENGRLFLCMTTRGFETIADSYQGVYSLGLTGFDLRLEGALFFGENDGILHGYHATKIVRHDNQWNMITTTHGGNKHTLAWAQTDADILHGIHYLECQELDFPHNNKPGCIFNSEDPDLFYDSKARKWRLAYCALKDNSYVTYLCESRKWNGKYSLIATGDTNDNTGIRITSIGGKRYVLSGGPGDTFYIFDYPSMKSLGSFKHEYPSGGFRGWPTIVPIRYGNYERYLWITFDRGAQTGRYSYGTLFYFLADKMWRIE